MNDFMMIVNIITGKSSATYYTIPVKQVFLLNIFALIIKIKKVHDEFAINSDTINPIAPISVWLLFT